MQVECDLCERWVMETATSFRFDLRANARWQDIDPMGGRSIHANDVVFSYARLSDPDHPNAPLLYNVAEVQAIDQATVSVILHSPDADALIALADGHSKVVAREVVELTGDLRDGPTVGSGPWVLENTADDVHRFSRNLDYYEPGLPLVERLNIMILSDDATRMAAFLTGLVDIQQIEPLEWLDYVARAPNAPFLAVPQPGVGVEVAFKSTMPPFDDVEVRRAAMLAMDPLKAIQEHWGGFGFIGPSFPVASPRWLLPDDQLAMRFNRPDDARSVLTDAGINSPIPVTIRVGDFGQAYLGHAHAISVELRAVGFDPETEIVNRREFGEDVWMGGNYQLMVGPPAPVTVPNGYLLPVLHSDGIWNTTGHRDKTLDGLLEAQAVESDVEARADLIHEVQKRVLDQAYRFMPTARVAVWTWSPQVKDFYPNFAAFEYHHWSRVWLSN